MLLTIVSFVIVLGVLVFFHELGHYWVARRNGIVVEEFGMGYPPRLIKLFRYDGTDFTINLIPFGGFARMKGEDASDMSPGSFNAASRGARAATLIAGPAMNAILAVVLFAFSFMAGFPAVAAYPEITSITSGSAADQAKLQPGDVLLKNGELPAYVSAAPDFRYDVWHQTPTSESSAPQTLVYSRDNQILQTTVPDTKTADEILKGINYRPVLTTQILATASDSPAAKAGLQAGDIVYSINGAVITNDYPLNAAVQQHLDQAVKLRVLRNNEWLDFEVTPRAHPPEGQGALGVQIGPITQLGTLPLLPALWQGVTSTAQYVMLVLQLPVMLIMGQLSPADAQLTGPVGIAEMVGGAVSATIDTGLWFPIWRLAAVLSAALAITNLLPLPALDGGRLLFILIEVLRGRRVNPEREGLVHMVGFMLLLGLLVFITFQDITTEQANIDWRGLLGR
ncbi:MAG TPA: RIP metalloprotease RseP [Caldilineaceae bacterium]|nr:RIP metalloprotease RseP [Caldilineaceae bacterium]